MTTESVGRASLALRLRHAEHCLEQRLLPSLRERELTMEQWRVMSVLLDHPGIAMSSLADAAVMPAASLTRNVDKLVERAVAIRRIDPQDKRRIVAALSPHGHALATQLRTQEESVERLLLVSGELADLDQLLV